ncbi:unnamed protein product, partial [Closterium sp. NIES-54]
CLYRGVQRVHWWCTYTVTTSATHTCPHPHPFSALQTRASSLTCDLLPLHTHPIPHPKLTPA